MQEVYAYHDYINMHMYIYISCLLYARQASILKPIQLTDLKEDSQFQKSAKAAEPFLPIQELGWVQIWLAIASCKLGSDIR